MTSIFNHRTIRKFKNQPIDADSLQKILEAAVRASNTGNMQLYSIIVTRDTNLKTQLCEKAHFNQNLVKQADTLLTFCVDISRFKQWCSLRNTKAGFDNFLSFYTASIDACIAAQNACIVAEDLGLGICYLGTANYTLEAHIELLKLPQGVFPVTAVAIGHPDDQPPLTDRLPLEAVIHYETYKPYSDSDIENLYSEKESLSFHKQLIEQNQTENLAQIFTQKRYTEANNKVFSQKMIEYLQKQGFMNNN